MRKQFLLMLILCLASVMVWAERIDVATARKVAESVAQREGVTGNLRSADELSLVYAAAPGQSGSALRSGTMEGAADYFVFNFPSGKGFAIVAGDDRVRPVLGYSDEGSFDPDNLPENLRGMLAEYQRQINWANDNEIVYDSSISAEWNRFLSDGTLRYTKKVELSKTTASWDQVSPYNAMCPLISGERTFTGCGATATAIIMKYHEWPSRAINGVLVHPLISDYPEWTCEPLDYSDDYNWDNMPLSVNRNTKQPEIAKLMWHIGANINMKYKEHSSSSNVNDIASALQDVFNYSHALRALQ